MSVLTPDLIMMCYIKSRVQEWKELTEKNRANSKPDKLDDSNNAKAEQVIDDLAILSVAINKNPDAFAESRKVLYEEMRKAMPMISDALFNPDETKKANFYEEMRQSISEEMVRS